MEIANLMERAIEINIKLIDYIREKIDEVPDDEKEIYEDYLVDIRNISTILFGMVGKMAADKLLDPPDVERFLSAGFRFGGI